MVSRSIHVNTETCDQRGKIVEFITKANSYASKLTIASGSRAVNAKSLMGVMAIGLFGDEEIVLQAEGADEEVAINDLTVFLETK